jgi:N4-(beta-N-acetylglucosaminyl)-L-asparaginase
MASRRKFIGQALGGALSTAVAPSAMAQALGKRPHQPIVISTWNNQAANREAWSVIGAGGLALDAVEQGVRLVEADPEDRSVGYGGRPDRDGHVTLDAAIMDGAGNCGAVCFLEGIKHPISVARRVMEASPHVMLAGEGAQRFAQEQGFAKEDLLTDASKQEWMAWKEEAEYKPIINIENHDTIGMLALDQHGNLAGACTTSGLAYKMHGRVGDSPIVGAGLYVDDEVGAAVATGLGESIIKACGSFLIVELMRQGYPPTKACEEAVRRIARRQTGFQDFQACFIALNKQGEHGGYALHKGFMYALSAGLQPIVFNAPSFI